MTAVFLKPVLAMPAAFSPGSLHRVVNIHSSKCLEIGFSGTAGFDTANQFACYGGTNQQWDLQQYVSVK